PSTVPLCATYESITFLPSRASGPSGPLWPAARAARPHTARRCITDFTWCDFRAAELLVRLRLCFNRAMPAAFHPAVAQWFARTFAAPTPAQSAAWPAIAAQRHVLIAAPTGSGKTVAAFLAAIDALGRTGLPAD